jgi:hypothetical protein
VNFFAIDLHDGLHEDVDDILDVANSSWKTLRELDLLGPLVGSVPIRIFSSLTHLEICVLSDGTLTGLELVFHHAVCLESLTLAGAIGFDVFQIFQRNPSAFPQLVSFQLSSSLLRHNDEECSAICEFIRGRFSLQRLCLRLSCPWKQVGMILPIVKEFPALQVLGFDVGYCFCDDFENLVSHFPPTLRALHLTVNMRNDLTDVGLLTPLVATKFYSHAPGSDETFLC